MLTGGSQHVLRQIHSDHSSFWQGLEQFGGESPGATPRIHQHFIAAKFQPGKDLSAPAELGLGQTVVRRSIPFAIMPRISHSYLGTDIPPAPAGLPVFPPGGTLSADEF